MEGNWTRSELEKFQQTGESGSGAIWELPAEQFSIDEEVIELEDAPAVCLNAEVIGEDVSQALSGLMGDEAFTLGIRNAEVTMDYTSYEPVEPCVLPEGAKEAAEQDQRLQEGNPDNGDGTFTIQERGYYVDVAAPEGYELESSGYD